MQTKTEHMREQVLRMTLWSIIHMNLYTWWKAVILRHYYNPVLYISVCLVLRVLTDAHVA